MGGSIDRDRPVHVPVLLERVIELLAPALERPGAVMVDATVGLGGHALAALGRFPEIRLIGLDRDSSALDATRRRLAGQEDALARTTLVHAVYDELPQVVHRLGLSRVSAVVFDLGVSSMQLDEVDRGFSYARDAPLDMRMDATSELTAAVVLNTYPERELARILRIYGEERFAARIAGAIVREREVRPLRSSARLVDLVRSAIPAATRRTGGHPARRTFQALRMEVNDELGALGRAIPASIDALEVGGRLIVLAYHSLEDRLVKRALAAATSIDVPPDLPMVPPEAEPALRLLTKGAEKASPAEIEQNPRSESVRLRAAQRVKEAA